MNCSSQFGDYLRKNPYLWLGIVYWCSVLPKDTARECAGAAQVLRARGFEEAKPQPSVPVAVPREVVPNMAAAVAAASR